MVGWKLNLPWLSVTFDGSPRSPLKTGVETKIHHLLDHLCQARLSIYTVQPQESTGKRTQTLHGTGIYADQLTPGQPPQLIGSPMAVPLVVSGEGR